MVKRTKKWLKAIIVAVFVTIIWDYSVSAEIKEISSEPATVIYDLIGNYKLSYVGNTNEFEYWNSNGSGKIIDNSYRDRTDISYNINSTATIIQTNDTSKIAKAYLIWETRSAEATEQPIMLYMPNTGKSGFQVKPQKVCKDTRSTASGEEYTGVYCMAADITSLVTSSYGGYGDYTVANIPLWSGPKEGEPAVGGESVASWQLVIVEESPEFTLKTISLNIMSLYIENQIVTTTIRFGLAASPTGMVNGDTIYGNVDVHSDYMYDSKAQTEEDKNYYHYHPAVEGDNHWYKYYTPTRGLYINGECINSRDQDKNGSLNGGIRVHLYDWKLANNQTSMGHRMLFDDNIATQFLIGASAEVLAYNVHFDANGGSGSMDDMECIYGRSYQLQENQFAAPDAGYIFAGWNTKADGSGNQYRDKSLIHNLTNKEEVVTLYAQWKPQTYKITLDANNAVTTGTPEFIEWYLHGNYSSSDCKEEIIKITPPIKTGYRFDGYYTNADGTGTMYVDSGGTILSDVDTFTEDTTLYAKWTLEVLKITLDNQGADITGTECYYVKYGKGNYASFNCITAITVIETPQKENYTFEGYYTEKNGEGTQIIDAAGTITSGAVYFKKDTTIYAFWQPLTYKIALDSQGATGNGTGLFYEKYGVCNYIDKKSADVSLGTTTKSYECIGAEQHFMAPYTGTYQLEVWGAEGGGNSAGKGGYSAGSIELKEGDELYLYVGGQGSAGIDGKGGYNGGGASYKLDQSIIAGSYVSAGGGATDIRKDGKKSTDRVLIAGGGGGSAVIGNMLCYNVDGQTRTIEFRGGDGNPIYGEQYAAADIVGLNLIKFNSSYIIENMASEGSTFVNYDNFKWEDIGENPWYRKKRSTGNPETRSNLHWYDYEYYNQYSTRINTVANQDGSNGSPYPYNENEKYSTDEVYRHAFLYAYKSRHWSYNPESYAFSSLKQASAGTKENGGTGCGGGYYGGSLYATDLLVFFHDDIFVVERALENTEWFKYAESIGKVYSNEKYYSWIGDYHIGSDHYCQFLTAGYGGSGYIGGVTDGVMEQGTRAGDGLAKISYINYTSVLEETSKIIIPTRKGYTFAGYYTEKDGNGTCYIDKNGNILSGYTTFTADTTLYARWIEETEILPDAYSITFHGNGATSGYTPKQYCEVGKQYQLNKNEFLKEGYVFSGWSLSENGAAAYQDREVILNLSTLDGANVNLYAVWRQRNYIVYFDANGGTGSMEPIELVYDKAEKLPVNAFTRSTEHGDSSFMGWSVSASATTAAYEDEAEVINLVPEGESSITLYAIWDDCPWIEAKDLYYTLDQAQSGFITHEELMSHATASDREDGANISPGTDEEKGTRFWIVDYQPSDFTQMQSGGSVTETYKVLDHAGNAYKKMITVYVVDTAAAVRKPEGTTRFINEYYYNQPYELGGLEDNSIWKTNPDYVAELLEAFHNLEDGTPQETYLFTHETVLQMKEYVKQHGEGNSKEPDALENFFELFMVPE